jgi:hypothetical protein
MNISPMTPGAVGDAPYRDLDARIVGRNADRHRCGPTPVDVETVDVDHATVASVGPYSL